MISVTFLGWVSLGAAIGACCRYVISAQLTLLLGGNFPYGTLLVNIVGSCLMGGVLAALINGSLQSDAWKPLLAVGFLGALTTFSTFSMDNVLLLEQREYLKAGLYTFLNLSLSVCLCYLCFYLMSE